MEPNDLAPHAAIIEVNWESHQRNHDGTYAGHAKDKGKSVFVLNGPDRALALEYVSALMELIRKNGVNCNELEVDTARVEQRKAQWAGESRDDKPKMLGMRGRIG